EAREAYQRGLVLYRNLRERRLLRPAPDIEMNYQQNIAMTDRELGEFESAITLYTELLSSQQTQASAHRRWVFELQLGQALARAGRLAEARQHLEGGLRLSEQFRQRAGSLPQMRQPFTGNSMEFYEELIGVLMHPEADVEDRGQAFTVAEQCRARTLLDL